MSDTVRVALVGCGEITEQGHLPAALATPGVEVTALVDSSLARAERLKIDFGLDDAKCFENVESVPAVANAAVIATPNHTHAAIAMPLVEAGVSVLVEKPLDASYERAKDLVEAAEKDSVVCAVGYCWRFWDSVLLIKEQLERGTWGKVHRFLHQEGSAGGWSPVSGYILSREQTGGGVTVVTGTHFLDRLLYWFGWPETFNYFDDSEGGPEANSFARMSFASKDGPIHGEFRFSKTTPIEAGIVIETDAGHVVLHETMGAPVLLRPADNPGLELEVRYRGNQRWSRQTTIYQHQMADFRDACLGKHKAMVTGREGLESVRFLMEMYSSRRPLGEAFADGAVEPVEEAR